MVTRRWLLLVLLFTDCALINAASGPFESQGCVFVHCDCIYSEAGCDPQYSCDEGYDCKTCNNDDVCEESGCGIDGICLGCQDHLAELGPNFVYETGVETYYCEYGPSPTCFRASCVTF